MESSSLKQMGHRIDSAVTLWVSTGIVAEEGRRSSLMARDPDGHAMLITENARI
jgi:hypothetical protein